MSRISDNSVFVVRYRSSKSLEHLANTREERRKDEKDLLNKLGQDGRG